MFVDDLDDVLRRCRDASVATGFGPVEFMPGVRLVIVEDPDGNWVEFVHRATDAGSTTS
jgi:catechol 2,3-dioxygenase-like lactoylglutathione lyase family enzyme